MATYTITTDYVHPPIPIRNMDWQAWVGDMDIGVRTGSGKTEREAVMDLLENLIEFESEAL